LTSLINDAFMAKLLIDEIVSTVMIAFLGNIIASFIWRKVYFHYKTDGLGTIKCYADMMVGVCAVMVIVPFFLLL
jgi:tryptophan-rich sensory protein